MSSNKLFVVVFGHKKSRGTQPRYDCAPRLRTGCDRCLCNEKRAHLFDVPVEILQFVRKVTPSDAFTKDPGKRCFRSQFAWLRPRYSVVRLSPPRPIDTYSPFSFPIPRCAFAPGRRNHYGESIACYFFEMQAKFAKKMIYFPAEPDERLYIL